MQTENRLEHYLQMQYPFVVSIDEDSGYVIEFPDLPGCMTQVETIQEIPDAAEEIRALWIETALAHNQAIPEPTYSEHYSGRFNLRLPRSLHRQFAEGAARDGVSLNQHVLAILSAATGNAQITQRLERVESRLDALVDQVSEPAQPESSLP